MVIAMGVLLAGCATAIASALAREDIQNIACLRVLGEVRHRADGAKRGIWIVGRDVASPRSKEEPHVQIDLSLSMVVCGSFSSSIRVQH